MMNHCQRLYSGAYFEDRAIRTERWKLVLRKFEGESAGRPGSLYDMESDPGERNDLYASSGQRGVLEDLARQLRAWGEREEDPLSSELGARVLMD